MFDSLVSLIELIIKVYAVWLCFIGFLIICGFSIYAFIVYTIFKRGKK